MTKKIRLVLSKNVSIPSDQNMTQVAKYVPKEEYFSTLNLYTTNVCVKHITIEKNLKQMLVEYRKSYFEMKKNGNCLMFAVLSTLTSCANISNCFSSSSCKKLSFLVIIRNLDCAKILILSNELKKVRFFGGKSFLWIEKFFGWKFVWLSAPGYYIIDYFHSLFENITTSIPIIFFLN